MVYFSFLVFLFGIKIKKSPTFFFFLYQITFSFLLLGFFECYLPQVSAGVFNTPHFINLGEFAVGVEPEFNFSSPNDGGSSLGVNLRYTYGITEINNLTGIVGSGGGSRKFRFGGNYTFDLFPDSDGQPGIGIAVQTLLVRLKTVGSLEITGVPYIHKAMSTEHGVLEPFFAVPIGLSLSDGRYQTMTTLVLGFIVEHNTHFRSVFEFGCSVNQAQTYFSGGLAYYH